MTRKALIMQILSQSTSESVVERSFTVGDVPGVLWSPAEGSEPAPFVLMGHPAGMHKRAPGLVARAYRLVAEYGFHAVAIDAPGHGDRPRSADDIASVGELQRARAAGEPMGAIVSRFNASVAERAVPEWQETMDALQALPEIDSDRPVGYSGMTLATEIGMRLMVADDRIGAAGLGGVFASQALLDVARRVIAPVQFLLAWDDPHIDRESGIALWDALGSAEKSLHAFPGGHDSVPQYEAEDSARFLVRHIMPR